jgi:leader peptidase (prepilin peptidase) / N-methyltransferase
MSEVQLLTCFAALFGLLIGSFLNVCVHRLPRDMSVVTPRSFCTSCGKTIAWFDNVPLLSFALLGGKCRACGARISWRYPLLELFTALLFAAAVWRMGVTWDAAKLCVFSALCAGLIFMDLEARILAEEFTIGGGIAGCLMSLLIPMPHFLAHLFLPDTWRESYLSLAEAVIGGIGPAVVLWGIGEAYYYLRGRDGLGFGDVMMIAMVGSFYGLEGSLLTLIIGSLAGSVIGVAFIALRGKDMSTYELPFGTFLGFAALVPPFFFVKPSGVIVVPW